MHPLLLFLLLSLLFFFSSLSFSSSSSSSSVSYLGCYRDSLEVSNRLLSFVQYINTTGFSPSSCIHYCSSFGYAYSGIEWQIECYCGKEKPKDEMKIEEQRCDMECKVKNEGEEEEGREGRTEKCGGSLALSVYFNPSASPLPIDSSRPLLCLVMILKNEAHTIASTLHSVLSIIDYWLILDTGSTDGTQSIIRSILSSVPGELHEEPFVDYGYTRNRILIIAKEKGERRPVFTLMLSADERVLNPVELREFVEEMRTAVGPMHGAYPLTMDTGIKFDSLRLARVDSEWRYKARVHEYLAPPSGPYIATYRPKKEIVILFNATDTERRYQSQFYIARILEEDLQKNENDTRSLYYLARTYGGVGNHSAAFHYYDLLAKRAEWDEEKYHGMVMKAIEARSLPHLFDWRTVQSFYLDAYAFKPSSMDALHSLAQYHFDSGRFDLSFLFALRAVLIPLPPNLQAVENVLLRPTAYLYEYEGERLLGFAAMEIKEWKQCIRSFTHVLKVKPEDNIVRARIGICKQKMKEKGETMEEETTACPSPPPPSDCPSSSSSSFVSPSPSTCNCTKACSLSSSLPFSLPSPSSSRLLLAFSQLRFIVQVALLAVFLLSFGLFCYHRYRYRFAPLLGESKLKV